MTKHLFALAGAAMALGFPASASVISLGSTAAHSCYRAAASTITPAPGDLSACRLALEQDALAYQDVVATHINRGIVLLRRGDTDAAIRDFDRAIQLDPRQPEAYLNKGVALVRRSDDAAAIQLFTVALENDTAKPEIAHFGRAVAHEKSGNIREAYFDYRRAAEIDPEWRDPQLELQRFKVVSG